MNKKTVLVGTANFFYCFCFNHIFCLSFLSQFTQGLVSQADDREAKRDTPEEGELRDQRMEITIRNSPYTRDDSTEDRYVELEETYMSKYVYVDYRVCFYGGSKCTCNSLPEKYVSV